MASANSDINRGLEAIEARIARKPRCYHEYCGTEATIGLTDYGQGKSGPFNPDRPVFEYRGVFGYCTFHATQTLAGRKALAEERSKA